MCARPMAIYYEHPDWFRPLFAELERRGLPYERLHAAEHWYDPGQVPRHSLLFNRMSPSAYLRGAGHAILATLPFLRYVERQGVRVINGSQVFALETSKAMQLELLAALGLPFPRATVIHRAQDAPAAARGLRFPVVVKPNIGGSGAGVRRVETPAELAETAQEGPLGLGIDQTALVQEFIPAAEGRITRVEVLGGRFLYGIRIYSTGDRFNLCPADVCRTTGGAELVRAACPVDAPANDLTVECYTPVAEVVRDVERIARAARLDVGGIEYLEDARDGRRYYYDVNALSNFVADGEQVLGFDPFERLVDYLERERSRGRAA